MIIVDTSGARPDPALSEPMSTDTQKYSDEHESEVPHSAFEEFTRDERRPAVLLLAGLVIASIFFALGILFGRWTDKRGTDAPAPTSQQGQASPVNRPLSTPSPSASHPAPGRTGQPSPVR